jgi:3'-5' exoribonuclease
MPKALIADLVPGQRVQAAFAVRSKALAEFRNKPGRYLSLVLGDRTGELPGRAWDNAEELAGLFEVGDVVEVVGRMDEYQGALQIIVSKLRRLDPEHFDARDFLRVSARDPEEMLAELQGVLDSVQNPHLRGLLGCFFEEPDFLVRFADAPGAKAVHHACLGGLLEHTLSVVALCGELAARHPEVDRDLLVAGALLHDLGKLEELTWGVTIDYTDRGRFLGHTVLSDRLICEALGTRPDFPELLAQLLRHIVLSHHGQREWGAPVVPLTSEACALHYADNLDARVQQFLEVREREGAPGKSWSEYHRLLERYLYIGPYGEAAAPEAESGSVRGAPLDLFEEAGDD